MTCYELFDVQGIQLGGQVFSAVSFDENGNKTVHATGSIDGSPTLYDDDDSEWYTDWNITWIYWENRDELVIEVEKD